LVEALHGRAAMAGHGELAGEEEKRKGKQSRLSVEDEEEGGMGVGARAMSLLLGPLCLFVLAREEEGKRRRKKKKKEGKKRKKKTWKIPKLKIFMRKIKHNLWDWSKNYFCKKKPNYN
jgi:hypothetical protein